MLILVVASHANNKWIELDSHLTDSHNENDLKMYDIKSSNIGFVSIKKRETIENVDKDLIELLKKIGSLSEKVNPKRLNN